MEVTLKINTEGIEKEDYFNILDKLSTLLDIKEVSISRNDRDNINDILSDLTFGSLMLELDDDFISSEEDYVEKEYLNSNISEKFFLENMDRDYKLLSVKSLYGLNTELFEKYPNKFDWGKISILPLKEDFIERHMDKLDIDIISTKDLSLEFIMDHIETLNLDKIRLTRNFNDIANTMMEDEYIEKYADKILELYQKEEYKPYFEKYESRFRDLQIDDILKDDDYDF